MDWTKLDPTLFEKLGSRDVPAIVGLRGKYRHWDTLRHIQPPPGLTVEELWGVVKMFRMINLKLLPLRDGQHRAVSYTVPDAAQEMLHRIDKDASGRIGSTSEPITNPSTRNYYLVSSLMEEAITSSQLEGASTTRTVAKNMIRTGRPPRNTSEQMILNNFRAMEHVRELVGQPLTPERVLNLHRILTEETLDKEATGRFRRSDEDIGVYDQATNALLYEPPAAAELPERMVVMCKFANEVLESDTNGPFVHPVIRAILLHLWLAMDHPFVDGNGRTARALFYWAMLSQGYWLCEFISISRILKKRPAKYAESFLYTETDDNDATYFILSQLKTICLAIDDLNAYVRKKVEELEAVRSLIRSSALFNHRQLALIHHALRNPGYRYTIESHRRSHDVVYETARTDLQSLEKMGLLRSAKAGKSYVFEALPNLQARLRKV